MSKAKAPKISGNWTCPYCGAAGGWGRRGCVVDECGERRDKRIRQEAQDKERERIEAIVRDYAASDFCSIEHDAPGGLIYLIREGQK